MAPEGRAPLGWNGEEVMDREERWIVSPSEIHGVRWQCGLCGAAVTYPATTKKSIRIPELCPACDQVAVDEGLKPSVHEVMQTFVNALSGLTRLPKGSGTVRLEFRVGPNQT